MPTPSIDKSPLMQKMLDHLRSGGKLTKHDAAALFGMNARVAARYLQHLHKAKTVRICGWQRGKDGPPTARYGLYNGRSDAPKPKPFTTIEKSLRYRNKDREAYNRRHTIYRWSKRAREGSVKLGLWGY